MYTYDPRKSQPLELVSKKPEGTIRDFVMKQNRFNILNRSNPEVFEELIGRAQADAEARFDFYAALAGAKGGQ